jgi:cytochrome b561
MPEVARFHPLLVALHWLLAIMIIGSLGRGALLLVNYANTDPRKVEQLRLHIIVGGVILTLMLARILVRTRTAQPAAAPSDNPLLNRLAWTSHRLLYLLVFALIGSGIMIALETNLLAVVFGGHGSLPPDFWAFTPRVIHYVISRMLMALIAVHITAALYHQFFLEDRLLRRMSFGRRIEAAVGSPPGKG